MYKTYKLKSNYDPFDDLLRWNKRVINGELIVGFEVKQISKEQYEGTITTVVGETTKIDGMPLYQQLSIVPLPAELFVGFSAEGVTTEELEKQGFRLSDDKSEIIPKADAKDIASFLEYPRFE